MLLALDTSTRTAGLALYDGSEVLVEFTWTSLDHHTVELAPAIADAFEKARVKYSDLAAMAVARGPGSFTGLRIGFALAKGLALSRHIPLITIPTLDFLAAAQPPRDLPMVALLRAGRGRLACSWYMFLENSWRSSGSLEVLTLEELIPHFNTNTLVCGELTAEERQLLNRDCPNALLSTPAQSLRRTAFLAELAWRSWHDGQIDDPATAAPLYLHYNEPIPE
ncbi:MAG: tRNA (adenosine(37)-N6)-threonylcarbamoyltransferase complex dimerization subunit type 1 TsaB [Chloroflexi bacterium RBG_16_54_18]|nr:MAG: tRNA (adenosine(37)-N6)-threonylcarbamoyltransferase complex dimerization subunit type 1 TsaB [Chloroflexi bacterium RBG_16_54_18]